jgi:hypothetical protein
MKVQHEIITWDWKEQIDPEHLSEAIKKVYDGKNCPRIYEVDTGQDCYAIVVASSEMTEEQVQAAWDADDE